MIRFLERAAADCVAGAIAHQMLAGRAFDRFDYAAGDRHLWRSGAYAAAAVMLGAVLPRQPSDVPVFNDRREP